MLDLSTGDLVKLCADVSGEILMWRAAAVDDGWDTYERVCIDAPVCGVVIDPIPIDNDGTSFYSPRTYPIVLINGGFHFVSIRSLELVSEY